jgi:hypothetical protein
MRQVKIAGAKIKKLFFYSRPRETISQKKRASTLTVHPEAASKRKRRTRG